MAMMGNWDRENAAEADGTKKDVDFSTHTAVLLPFSFVALSHKRHLGKISGKPGKNHKVKKSNTVLRERKYNTSILSRAAST